VKHATARTWFALTIRETGPGTGSEDQVALVLDDFLPLAIEDLQTLPLPPGGLWDPTLPPPPDPPPAPLAWRAFFETAATRDAAVDALRVVVPALSLVREDVDDEDWAARSQRAVSAIRTGEILVAPPWDVPAALPDGHTLVVIEPSRGFGTGHHQSTRLCLRALSSVAVGGLRVLDLGTGSGVLAMAAALRGAADVLGVDVDPDAIASARESQTLNPGAAGVTWLVADFRDTPLPSMLAGGWDLVLANLTGGMLRASAARLRELMAPTGRLIASGFVEPERDEVLRALQLPPEEILVEDSWIGLVVRAGYPTGRC
jgi:ribosomal protein L11 methyltransferase